MSSLRHRTHTRDRVGDDVLCGRLVAGNGVRQPQQAVELDSVAGRESLEIASSRPHRYRRVGAAGWFRSRVIRGAVGRRRVLHEPGPTIGETVSANDNLKTIQSVYEAFGRGDVAAILETLTDDVDWASEAADPAGAPWYGVRRGRDAVAAFFEAFGSTMEVEEFTPPSFAANDTEVLTVVRMRAKSA